MDPFLVPAFTAWLQAALALECPVPLLWGLVELRVWTVALGPDHMRFTADTLVLAPGRLPWPWPR